MVAGVVVVVVVGVVVVGVVVVVVVVGVVAEGEKQNKRVLCLNVISKQNMKTFLVPPGPLYFIFLY